MRKKFKIMYPEDFPDSGKAGKRFKPTSKSMVVMSDKGVFFLFTGDDYNSYIQPLSDILPKYDVVWED